MKTALAFTLILAGLQPAAPKHQLSYEPREGETWQHEITYDIRQGEDRSTVEAQIEMRVDELHESGQFDLRVTTLRNMVRTALGEVVDDRRVERTLRHGANGAVVRVVEGEADVKGYRQALLTRFVSPPQPVAVGDTWGYSRPENRPEGVPGVSIEYRFAEIDPSGLVQVPFRYQETTGDERMTASGTWWVDADTGRPARLEADVENFLGEPGTSAKIRLVETQPET